VARTTLTQRVEGLEERLNDLDSELDDLRAINDVLISKLEDEIETRTKFNELLQSKHVESAVKVATLEEKSRMLEKLSDRGWQIWLALIGAALALLVALFKA